MCFLTVVYAPEHHFDRCFWLKRVQVPNEIPRKSPQLQGGEVAFFSTVNVIFTFETLYAYMHHLVPPMNAVL